MPCVLQGCHIAPLWRRLPQTGQTGTEGPLGTRASILRPVSSFLTFYVYLPWPFQLD